MVTLSGLRAEVGTRVMRGEALETIEADVIEPSGLSSEEKSVLWLYGWATRESGRVSYRQRQDTWRPQARHHPSPKGVE